MSKGLTSAAGLVEAVVQGRDGLDTVERGEIVLALLDRLQDGVVVLHLADDALALLRRQLGERGSGVGVLGIYKFTTNE
jgi:hypothetical protein